MKTTYLLLERIKMSLAILFCLFVISSCISDGYETVVLEKGNTQVRKMLLGGWKLSSKTVVDENGKEISREDISENSMLEFFDDGSCIETFPDGNTMKQDWSLSDDFYSVSISDAHYEIYTLGKNILVLIIEYEEHYLKLIYYKVSSPEPEEEGEGEIGGIDDNNPYRPYAADKKVTKIVVDGSNTYTFGYDSKGRIMRYKTPSKTYTFTYDDTKVYLWFNGKIVNTGLVGSNGYLTTIWEGYDASRGVSTFTYNSNKNISKLEYEGNVTQIWTPIYSGGNMERLYSDGSHNFTYHSSLDNYLNIDLNGFISAMYQWEWFMHDAEVIWGLFDFYGKRSVDFLSKEKTNQWTNSFDYYWAERDDLFALRITQMRTGLNANFNRKYEIYTTD